MERHKPLNFIALRPIWALVACALGLWAPVGCRSVDNAQLDVLERELRKQEDYIYELEDYLLEYSEKLQACRQARARGQGTAGSPASQRAAPSAASRGSSIPEPELVDDTPSQRSSLKPRSSSLQRNSPAAGVRSQSEGTNASAAADSSSAPDAGDRRSRSVLGTNSRSQPAVDEVLPEPATAPSRSAPPPAAPRNPEMIDPELPETDEIDPELMEPGDLEVPDLEFGASTSPTREQLASADSPGPLLVIPDPLDYHEYDQVDPVEDPRDTALDQVQAPEISLAERVPDTDSRGEPSPAPFQAESRFVPRSIAIQQVLSQDDEITGERSLLVVLEAHSERKEPVDADGEVSLMVMAADAPGSLRPIKRWDFTDTQARNAWQSTSLGDGLHLQLPLEEADLTDGALQLWARMVTPRGEKLLTKIPLEMSGLQPLDLALRAASAERASRSGGVGLEYAASDGAMPSPDVPSPDEHALSARVRLSERNRASSAAGTTGLGSTNSGSNVARSTGGASSPPGSAWRAAPHPAQAIARTSSQSPPADGRWQASSQAATARGVPGTGGTAELGRGSAAAGTNAPVPGRASVGSEGRWQPFR
jgi:hypothetical protein